MRIELDKLVRQLQGQWYVTYHIEIPNAENKVLEEFEQALVHSLISMGHDVRYWITPKPYR